MIDKSFFEDKCILITGGSSGIGRATAIALSKAGARVAIVARNKERMLDTISMMDDSKKHLFIAYDLSDLTNYGTVFNELKREGFILDGLVHCAGVSRVLPLRALSLGNMTEIFNIHFFSFLELVKWYAKKGVSNGGSIVGISAINAHVPQKCMTVYSSSKAAVECACRSLALELVEKNIRINSVVVGGIKTEMSEVTGGQINSIKSDYVNPVSRQILGIGSADSIVGAIRFLLSEDSSFITGREIYADGGLL